jgi:hypothetical protein
MVPLTGSGVSGTIAPASLEPAVLAGFDLKPLGDDGSGVSITESMQLLTDFLGWQNRREFARLQADAEALALAAEVEAREREAAEAAVASQ